jgi:hypothetical protein
MNIIYSLIKCFERGRKNRDRRYVVRLEDYPLEQAIEILKKDLSNPNVVHTFYPESSVKAIHPAFRKIMFPQYKEAK